MWIRRYDCYLWFDDIRKPAVKRSTADLQNEARRIVWDDLSEHLKQLSSGTQVVKELERLLIAA